MQNKRFKLGKVEKYKKGAHQKELKMKAKKGRKQESGFEKPERVPVKTGKRPKQKQPNQFKKKKDKYERKEELKNLNFDKKKQNHFDYETKKKDKKPSKFRLKNTEKLRFDKVSENGKYFEEKMKKSLRDKASGKARKQRLSHRERCQGF